MYFALVTRMLFVGIAFASIANHLAAQEVMLRGELPPAGFQRIRQKFGISGELLLNPHGKGVTRVPLSVAASVDFHQRYFPGSSSSKVRHYHVASAEIQYGEGDSAESITPHMRDDRRTICLTKIDGHDTYFSPVGALTREELELIDTPTCRIDLVELLPDREVGVGDEWEHESELLARLLNLDAVSTNKANSHFDSIEGSKATITLEGEIAGAANGANTEIELKAKYVFDTKSKRVTSLAMAYRERRSVARAEPGFEVVARLSMAEASIANSAELSNASLANFNFRTTSQSGWLQFSSAHGGYNLLLNPRWQTLLDQPGMTILRFVDDGELIAQANLARMTQSEAEASITLEAFSAEAGQALEKNLGQLLESKQYESSTGNRVLRVEASGTVSEVDMRWIYYHISNNAGLRASCVVTVEEEHLKRFGGADSDLIDVLELAPLPEAEGEPTPASTARQPASE